MTRAYPFKTLEQAKAVREATERVNRWPLMIAALVTQEMPKVARDAGHQESDWRVTVETQRRDWETPVDAADRVARWVTLWAEVYGKPPTERAIQRTVEPPNTDGSADYADTYRVPTPQEYTRIRPPDTQS